MMREVMTNTRILTLKSSLSPSPSESKEVVSRWETGFTYVSILTVVTICRLALSPLRFLVPAPSPLLEFMFLGHGASPAFLSGSLTTCSALLFLDAKCNEKETMSNLPS